MYYYCQVRQDKKMLSEILYVEENNRSGLLSLSCPLCGMLIWVDVSEGLKQLSNIT